MLRSSVAVVAFVVCFAVAAEGVASGPIQDGLRLSIALSTNRPKPAVTLEIDCFGDLPRSLTVGTNFNNQDHWNIEAILATRDGKNQTLVHLPGGAAVTGRVGPFTIELRPHVPYRADLPLDEFELEGAAGHVVKLADFISSGDRLQLRVRCGPRFSTRIKQDPWRGDLVSGWLTL